MPASPGRLLSALEPPYPAVTRSSLGVAALIEVSASFIEDHSRFARAAGLSRRSKRIEIVFVPGALARIVINERPAPRVFGHVFSSRVGSGPTGNSRWPSNQCL